MHFINAAKGSRAETDWDRLTPFQRHLKLVCCANDGKAPREWRLAKTDMDVFEETFEFVRSLEADEALKSDANVRMARKYYDELSKEYVLADLKHYKDGRVGFRWRSRRELEAGKGHFDCGNLICEEIKHLRNYEVHFKYKERGVAKEALVKVRLCPRCAFKLHYKTFKRRKRRKARKEREAKRSKRCSSVESVASRESESEQSETGSCLDEVGKGHTLHTDHA